MKRGTITGENTPFHISIRILRVELDCLIDVSTKPGRADRGIAKILALDQGRDVLGVETKPPLTSAKHDQIIVLVPHHTFTSIARTSRADRPAICCEKNCRHGREGSGNWPTPSPAGPDSGSSRALVALGLLQKTD